MSIPVRSVARATRWTRSTLDRAAPTHELHELAG
jgi:hypothetical protein